MFKRWIDFNLAMDFYLNLFNYYHAKKYMTVCLPLTIKFCIILMMSILIY